MKLVSPEAALKAIVDQHKCLLIDIREPYERNACKIECLAIPMAEFVNRYANFDTYEKVILMCQSGKRAEALANFIETEYNATNLYVLEGGINAWINENAPHISCQ